MATPIEEDEDNEEDNEEDNVPLQRRKKKPDAPPISALAKDQEEKGKGKEKMSEESAVVVRSYTTRGTEKNLLSDTMVASREKHAMKKGKKVVTVVEDDIPED